MSNEVWYGHQEILKEPCRAVFLDKGKVMYLVEDNEQEPGVRV